MKRISGAVLAAALAVGSVSGALAQDEEQGTIKIGMANLSLCCAYFIGMSQAVEQEAANYSNVEVLVTNADGDVEKLTSDIEDLIARGVDGIVLSGAFIEAAPAALVAIQQAGIPVVMVDRLLKGGEYTSWVGPDNRAIGEQTGQFIVDQLGGTGKLGVIRGGPADNTIGSDRTDGMLSQVEGTDIEVITFPDFAGWSTDGGFAAAETLLAQNPDLDAIFCENDSMCLGAQKVIEEQGLADQVFVVGVDGQKEALVEIIEDGVYKATGLNNSDQIGRAGFNRLMAILAGAEAEKDTVLPSPLITIENVQRFYDPDSVF
ncbi:substrate-binding domain-containing protein [soil metagenome]